MGNSGITQQICGNRYQEALDCVISWGENQSSLSEARQTTQYTSFFSFVCIFTFLKLFFSACVTYHHSDGAFVCSLCVCLRILVSGCDHERNRPVQMLECMAQDPPHLGDKTGWLLSHNWHLWWSHGTHLSSMLVANILMVQYLALSCHVTSSK